jgi:hypothetical protein
MMSYERKNIHILSYLFIVQIVESEVRVQQQQQKRLEKQLEEHQQHDNSVSLGVKVAAVTVGGVVVGAFTLGLGLIPYLAVVGFGAMAGGGAVALTYKKPSDSRLILACETMHEALAWKEAFELQVLILKYLILVTFFKICMYII